MLDNNKNRYILMVVFANYTCENNFLIISVRLIRTTVNRKIVK